MPLFAYLDPVTGSALVQVLLGAAAAIGLGWQYIRRWSRKAVSYLRSRKSVDSLEGTAPATSDRATPDT